MKVKDYKDLNVWQKGIEITHKTYELTNRFPRFELFGLSSQMRKAATSIPSNIAEGFVRRNSGEYRQFLYISLGSCAELDTQFSISLERKYINQNETMEILDDINHEMRMLFNLIKQIRNKITKLEG